MFRHNHLGAAGKSAQHMFGLLLVAVSAAGCDSAQLLAPTKSTIAVSAPARVLPTGGSTEITAYVVESAGTVVQNGTAVRFTTTLGSVEPATALTRNGIARTTFSAGSVSGIAEIRATSGAAGGAPTGDTATTTQSMVRITVGAAAVSTVTLRANPGSVGPSGGTVELVATVVGENAEALEGILVTFSADHGSLSAPTATTGANGEARVNLSTSQQTIVSATAGTKTSPNVTVGVRAGPIVSIACAPTTGTGNGNGNGNCGAVQATGASSAGTVQLTVTKASGSSALRSARLDFGDGESLDLGNLASGSAVVTHAYAGPEGTAPRTYTATVRSEDVNGETASASTTIIVVPRAPVAVGLTSTAETATTAGQRWTFVATVTGDGTAGTVQSYAWDFGDGGTVTTSSGTTAHVYTADGNYTVVVTVKMLDGRTSSATTQVLVNIP